MILRNILYSPEDRRHRETESCELCSINFSLNWIYVNIYFYLFFSKRQTREQWTRSTYTQTPTWIWQRSWSFDIERESNQKHERELWEDKFIHLFTGHCFNPSRIRVWVLLGIGALFRAGTPHNSIPLRTTFRSCQGEKLRITMALQIMSLEKNLYQKDE